MSIHWFIDALAGGFKHLVFSIIYGIILPIDEVIFFKMVKTTNQLFGLVLPGLFDLMT